MKCPILSLLIYVLVDRSIELMLCLVGKSEIYNCFIKIGDERLFFYLSCQTSTSETAHKGLKTDQFVQRLCAVYIRSSYVPFVEI